MNVRGATIAMIAVATVIGACQRDEAESPAAAPEPSVVAPTNAKPEPIVPRAIVMPELVPALATGIVVITGEADLATALAAIDPMRSTTDGIAKEIDDYLAGRFGARLAAATQLTGFILPGEPKVAAIVDGVSVVGQAGSESIAMVDGTPVYAVDGEEIVTALAGTRLVVGHFEAVRAALLASKRDQSNETPIVAMLMRQAAGAHLALAVTPSVLPDEARRWMTAQQLTHVVVALHDDRLTVAVTGAPEALTELQSEIGQWQTLAVGAAADYKESALQDDDPLEVVIATTLQHLAQRVSGLDPQLSPAGELVGVVPIRGAALRSLSTVAMLLGASALPTISKTMRRNKTIEARVQVARMFDAAATYFGEEHVLVEVLPDGSTVSSKRHACPTDGGERGEAGMTPSLSIDCNEGPDAGCTPYGLAASGSYEAEEWSDNRVWRAMEFSQTKAHAFHYNFRYENFPGAYGGCQFTAQAFGDLDSDGVFSTFERVGIADETGVRTEGGLAVDHELE